jgi:hypothetical protein
MAEIITVTKISGKNVTYSGSEFFDGCDISNFPHRPEIGERFILTSSFIDPSVISELDTN